MDRIRHHDPLPPAPVVPDAESDFELWEPESNDRIRPQPRGLQPRTMASVPGAVGGALLVCAIAFGATLGSTPAPTPAPDGGTGTSAATTGGTTRDATLANAGGYEKDAQPGDGHDGGVAKPGTELVDGPKADPVPDAPKDEPAAPVVQPIDLALGLGDGRTVKLDWGGCEVDGFIAWKLIRGTDGTPTYPRGDGDVLVRVIEKQDQTSFTDTTAPAGRKLTYAVFGLGGTGYARNIACVSSATTITTLAEEPKPEPKPEPKDPPAETPISLSLKVKDGAVLIDWSACKAQDADYYKLVRSKDSPVSWPAGDGDAVVAAVEIGGTTAAWDKDAPAGKKAWYRVFCVRHTDDGYKVLVASAARAIVAPAGEPAPKPSAMWLQAAVEAGQVVLHWEASGGETFSHYRVLRKADGVSQIVAEIEDAGATTWTDGSVVAGGTYKYLVQAKGVIDGSYVLLGTTDYAVVTVD